MSKKEIKRKAYTIQNGVCSITGSKLPIETSLFDTHRPIPKSKGGTYGITTKAVCPVAHQEEHSNYRERSSELDSLKEIVDKRNQIISTRIGISNRLLSHKRRTDILGPETRAHLQIILEDINTIENKINKELKKATEELAKVDQLTSIVLQIKGVGFVTAAYLAVYIDLSKARHASSLWKYVGLDKASHERYEKGTSGGGNKRLRSVLWTMADSQIKNKNRGSAYGYLEPITKTILSTSKKLVRTCNTEGKWEVKPWKDTKPSHRHGAALRVIMKHFLADYWYVGRTILGLPVSECYAESKLGGNHRTIKPEERGWKYYV